MSINLRKHQQPTLPLEHSVRNEAKLDKARWAHGCFNFLLQRTANYYDHKSTQARRSHLETTKHISLPMIDDSMLLALYRMACFKYLNICYRKYLNSGFERTYHEKVFLNVLHAIAATHPKFRHLEVYPSSLFSKDLSPIQKMVVGIHVPDFLIFGLKHPGYSSLAIELDGDSHVDKFGKDALYYDHLKELGVFCWSIPNEKITDQNYILKGLESFYRQRSGALDRQIKKHKRDIWCKTITCNLTLLEIEKFAKEQFQIDLNLMTEAELLLNQARCPRPIRTELKRVLLRKQS